MGQEFTDSWRTWTWHNVRRGCSKDGVFKILLDEGFDYDLIREELHYEPTVDVDQLVNPLKRMLGEAQVGTDTDVDPSQSKRLPIYTRDGFTQLKAPTIVFEKLATHYREHGSEAVVESVPGFINGPRGLGSELISLPDSLKSEVHEALRPTIETWCGVQLEPTYVYGIRRYLRYATLAMHRDRIATHVLGAIVNIDQTVEQGWPLVIEDHLGRAHDLFLAPGDLFLYEAARLLHGRPRPLQGESYASVFVHYRPRGVNRG